MAHNENDPLRLQQLHDTMVRTMLVRSGLNDMIESCLQESRSNMEHANSTDTEGTDDVRQPEEMKQSPKQSELHQALRNGDFVLAEQLIDQGHDPCEMDAALKSPLHVALYACASYKYDHQSIKQSLWVALIKNSTINQRDSDGNYPIDIAASMKMKPLPFPVLCKLMSPENMTCCTFVKIATIVNETDFLKVIDFALPLLRPKDLKFNEWKSVLFDNLDETCSNCCSQVTCLNRMLLRRCVDRHRNIDQKKVRQLMILLWKAGYSDVGMFTENAKSKSFVEKPPKNVLVGIGTENDGSHNALMNLLCNPRSLTDLCRITVRNHVRDLSAVSFMQLNLPPCILCYLTFNRIT